MKELIYAWKTVNQIHLCCKSSNFIGTALEKNLSHSIYPSLYRRMPFIKVIFLFVAPLLTYFSLRVAKVNDKDEDEYLAPYFFYKEFLMQRNITLNLSL